MNNRINGSFIVVPECATACGLATMALTIIRDRYWDYQPRDRRHCVGELIQIDGSDHRRCEDRAPANVKSRPGTKIQSKLSESDVTQAIHKAGRH